MLRSNRPSRGLRSIPLLGLAALGLLFSSCSSTSSTPPPVGVSVSWLTERGTIPDDVTGLQFVVIRAMQTGTCINRDAGPLPEDPTCSAVGSPPTAEGTETTNSIVQDLDRDGRAEILADSLPINTPFSIELRAFDDPTLHVGYIGRVGPIVLAAGERRHIAVRMYRVGATTELVSDEMTGRFLQTATALKDGRVLITGGFTQGPRGDCPTALGSESRCFDLVASDEAWLFEPATARFFPVANGMLAARGGHTATRLPDGRVLIAGGASRAQFQLVSVGTDTARGFEPRFVAAGGDASSGSFEIFDPALNPELDDVDADGDPARGGFVGSANDPSAPGRLDQGRFMHAAAPVSGSERVLLAGGSDAEGRGTWEIFDLQKPGGYGVYFNPSNILPTARTLPSAMTSTDGVWIVGGADATDNAGLADVWTPEMGDPNGRVRSAREFTGARYPNPAGSSEMPRPQYALLRPTLAPLDNGSSMLTVGWFGPRCAPGSMVPDFSAAANERCTQLGGPTRSHTVALTGGEAGATVATTSAPSMSFGTSATLDDGSVFVAGGISQILWRPVIPTATLFEANTLPGTGSAVGSGEIPVPRTGRVFAASAPFPGRGVLTVGGITSSTWESLSFVPNAEVWLRKR
ncbi:MAG: hypothetical protein GXP55_17350 [Deltaproteobacteria bacterium]|nr:hypothetical protein [Deltaproteobacteria bacterium]